MSKRGFCFAKANHKVNHQPNHQLGLLSLSLSLSLSSNFLFLYDEGATINREAITTAFFSHRRNPLLAKTLFFLMHTLTPIFSHSHAFQETFQKTTYPITIPRQSHLTANFFSDILFYTLHS